MYSPLLLVHSLVRWLVLLVLVARVGRGAVGLATGAAWGRSDRILGGIAVGLVDLQVLMGLGLYFVSPKVSAALADMGAAMGQTHLRFWAVEHITTMILGAVAVHVAHAVSKRSAGGRAHTIATVGFGLGLLFILAGIPWAFRGAL